MDKCPCCGQTLLENVELSFSDKYFAVTRNGKIAQLTHLQYQIVSALRRRGMTMSELIEAIYSGRADGGPDTAISVLHVSIKLANNKLKRLGVTVAPERKGPHETPYKIRPCHA